MALDLNKAPPNDEEVLPHLNKPLDGREFFQQYHDLDAIEFARGQQQQLISPVEGGGTLPDLNEQPANEEELLQIHEAQQEISLIEGGGALLDLNEQPINEEEFF